MKRLLQTLAIVIAFCVGFLYAGTALVSSPWAQERLQTEVRALVYRLLGLTPHWDYVELYPLLLEVEVHGLRVYSGAVTENTPFLQVPRVRAGIAPLELLRRDIEITITAWNPYIVFGNDQGEWYNFLNLDKIDELVDAADSDTGPPSAWTVEVGRVALVDGEVDFSVTDIDLRAHLTEFTAEARFDRISTERRIPIKARRGKGMYRMFGRDTQIERLQGELAVEIIEGPWVDLVFDSVEIRANYPSGVLHGTGRIVDISRRHLFKVAGQGEVDASILNDFFFDVPELTGTLTYDATYNGDFKTFQVAGTVGTDALLVDAFLVGDASVAAEVSADGLRIASATGNLWDGRYTFAGALDFASLEWSADADFAGLRFHELRRRIPGLPRITGNWGGGVSAVGDLDDPRQFAGDFRLLPEGGDLSWGENHVIPIPAGEIRMLVTSDPVQLLIEQGSVENGRESIQFAGLIDWQTGATAIDLSLQSGDLSPVGGITGFDIRGWGTADGRWTGTLAEPHFLFNIDARDVELPWVRLAIARGSLDVNLRELRLAFVTGEWPSGRAQVDAAYIGPFDGDVHVSLPVKATRVPLSAILDPLTAGAVPVDGYFTGDFLLESPVTQPTGYAAGTVTDAVVWGEHVERVEGRMDIREGALEFSALRGWDRNAGFVAGGTIDPGGDIDFTVRGRDVSLARIDVLAGYGLSGTGAAELRIRGAEGRPIAMHAHADAHAVEAAGVSFGHMRAWLASEGDAFAVRATGDTAVAELDFHAEGNYPGRLRAEANGIDLSPWLSRYMNGEVEFLLSGQADLQGPLLDWRQASGVVTMPTVRLLHNRSVAQSEAPVTLTLGDGRISIPKTALTGKGAAGTVGGSVGMDGSLKLAVNAGVDLQIMTAFIDTLQAAEGLLQIEGTVGGTLTSPAVHAGLRTRGARLKLRDVDMLFEDVDATAAFNDDQIVIDRLHGRIGGGTISGGGLLTMDGLVPTSVSLFATLDEAEARVPSWLLARVSGRVELVGPIDDAILRGDLEVVRAVYDAQHSWESLILRLRRPEARAGLFEKKGLHFDLNLHSAGSILIRNNLADAKLKGNVNLTGYPLQPGVTGNLQFNEGIIVFRENAFQVENGQINFVDGSGVEPYIDLQARTRVQELTTGPYSGRYYDIRLIATGTPDDLRIDLESQPPLDRGDILSLLYMRRRATEGAGGSTALGPEAVNLAIKLNDELAGFQSEIQQYFGFEQLVLEPAFTESRGSGTMKLRASKVLRQDLTANLATSLTGSDLEVRLGYSVTENFFFDLGWNSVAEQQIRTEAGNFGNFRVRPRLHFEFQ